MVGASKPLPSVKRQGFFSFVRKPNEANESDHALPVSSPQTMIASPAAMVLAGI